jgi:hypothetical protein
MYLINTYAVFIQCRDCKGLTEAELCSKCKVVREMDHRCRNRHAVPIAFTACSVVPTKMNSFRGVNELNNIK